MDGRTFIVTKNNKTMPFKSGKDAANVDMISLLKTTVEYKQGNGGDVLESSFDRKAFENGSDRFVPTDNGFVYSVVHAYNNHHDLIIRPDDVWIAITTQFSLYLNANAEELRSHFVNFEGQRELVVKQAATLRSADYGNLIDQTTLQIEQNLKDESVREWVIADFSTTTDNDRIVSEVILMGAMQKYFKYKFCLCCGIPKITVRGTKEDWLKIKSRVAKLSAYGAACEKWVAMLNPIVDEFVAVFGEPTGGIITKPKNLQFWQTICHETPTGSGPTYLSGWISAFCVFGEKGNWQGDHTVMDTWMGGKITNGIWPVVDINDIPPGYVTVPVTINDNGVEHKARLFAGHLAFSHQLIDHPKSQSDANVGSSLQPRVVWSIVLLNGPEKM